MRQKEKDTSFSRYPFVYLLAALAPGIVLQHFFPNIPTTPVVCLLLAVVLTALFPFFVQRKPYMLRVLQIYCLFAAVFLSGILLGIQTDSTRQQNWMGRDTAKAKVYFGKIITLPEEKPKTIKLTVAVEKENIAHQWKNTSGKVLLYIYKQNNVQQFKKGERFIFSNKIIPISNSGNPFEFDYAHYLRQNGFYYEAFLSPDQLYPVSVRNTKPTYLDRLRKRLLLSIQKNIHDTATLGLTEATLLNDRGLLNHEIRHAYSITGIAHIIAISGMHVSLFFSILLFLLWWMKSPRLKWIKYLFALPIIWAYIAITNFPPSAVRAAVMFSIVSICLFLKREPRPLNFLAATGFMLLCCCPNWLFDTGIQLSFAAVASIYLFFRPIYRIWQPKGRILKYLWGTLAASLAVQILIFPIVLLYFHQIPVWSLVANIPASIYSLILMVSALLLFLLDGLGIPALWLGKFMVGLTHGFHKIVFWLAAHTPETMQHLYISTPEFWLLLTCIIFICLYVFFKKVRFAFIGISLCCLLTAYSIYRNYQYRQQERIVVYNAPRHSIIDYIKGKHCYTLGENIANRNQNTIFQYILLPARLGFGIKNISTAQPTSSVKIIHNKRILFLNTKRNMDTQKTFHVDYLILSNKCIFQPKKWISIFHPKQIILDGSFTRGKAAKWEMRLSADNIPVHNVKNDGAWVFPKNY